MMTDPPALVSACLENESDIKTWRATIIGPPDTPYSGGAFELQIKLSDDYPHSPPQIKMLTTIYHMNFYTGGDICLNFSKDWVADNTIADALVKIIILLSDPNPEDPVKGDIANQYKTDRNAHDAKVREWVQLYAQM